MTGIRKAFEKNQNRGYSHMLIVKSLEEQNSDFYYVRRDENTQEVIANLEKEGNKVQYVYSYDLDLDLMAYEKAPFYVHDMEQVVLNDKQILEQDVTRRQRKSRAVMFSQGKLVLECYAGVYMLPGGKVDGNEDYPTALKREIKEETGFVLDRPIVPLIRVVNYMADYPLPDGKTCNYKVTTNYYTVLEKFFIDYDKIQMTEREKKGDLRFVFCKLNEAAALLKENDSDNPHKAYYDEELSMVLEQLEKQKTLSLK